MNNINHEAKARVPQIKVYPDKFLDHVVIVTGAASGIGETTAHLFAQQGATVILLDINQQKLEDVQKNIRQNGEKAEIQLCDVTDYHSVDDAIKKTIEKFHKIDVLANIAGLYTFHPLVDHPIEEYRRLMSINLDGSFFLTRAVMPHMQHAGYGRIIHTSSSTFGCPEACMTAYVSSKAGVIGLVRASAMEAGPGITVNVVIPGLTETATVASMENHSALFDIVLSRQAVKRRGHPLDAAHAFSFIASPEAAFFTGQIFECSGGESFH